MNNGHVRKLAVHSPSGPLRAIWCNCLSGLFKGFFGFELRRSHPLGEIQRWSGGCSLFLCSLRRASLNPVNWDAFQPWVETTRLNRPARLAVGLELESALLERRFASRHNCAPEVVRRRATRSGSPALTCDCEIRLHRSPS